MAEFGSTSYCPACPTASQIIHSLYNGSHPFYYITLVYDKSEVANRKVRDIDIDLQAGWKENNIEIIVNVKNNGRTYFGHLRICIAEIESRWLDERGERYHYALMDYALDKYVFLSANSEKKFNVVWENKYSLQQGNVMILAYISNWIPHIQKNPWEKPKPNHFVAQWVDEVNAIEI